MFTSQKHDTTITNTHLFTNVVFLLCEEPRERVESGTRRANNTECVHTGEEPPLRRCTTTGLQLQFCQFEMSSAREDFLPIFGEGLLRGVAANFSIGRAWRGGAAPSSVALVSLMEDHVSRKQRAVGLDFSNGTFSGECQSVARVWEHRVRTWGTRYPETLHAFQINNNNHSINVYIQHLKIVTKTAARQHNGNHRIKNIMVL